MDTDNIFVGSAKVVQTKYGGITKLTMHKDHINELIKYIKQEGRDFVNIAICEKRTKVEGKATHYAKIDTWKPEQAGGLPQPEDKGLNGDMANQFNSSMSKEDDLPF
jgi:hypothetical protein